MIRWVNWSLEKSTWISVIQWWCTWRGIWISSTKSDMWRRRRRRRWEPRWRVKGHRAAQWLMCWRKTGEGKEREKEREEKRKQSWAVSGGGRGKHRLTGWPLPQAATHHTCCLIRGVYRERVGWLWGRTPGGREGGRGVWVCERVRESIAPRRWGSVHTGKNKTASKNCGTGGDDRHVSVWPDNFLCRLTVVRNNQTLTGQQVWLWLVTLFV